MSKEPSKHWTFASEESRRFCATRLGLWEHLGAGSSRRLAPPRRRSHLVGDEPRSELPIAQIKPVLRVILQIVRMSFEHVDAIVRETASR